MCGNLPGVSSSSQPPGAVDLWWLPLGAGGRSVRWNGRVYEALVARRTGRPVRDLYHAALEAGDGAALVVIEVAPVLGGPPGDRGAVASGPVGARWAGRSALFRYEVRRWAGGVIPDRDEAVASPQRLSDDPAVAARLLRLVPHVPTPVWGRDELRAGEMWNSNSVVAWLIARAGIDPARARIPAGGRAPGWDGGLAVAARQPPSTP
jgi:hypothetical protein